MGYRIMYSPEDNGKYPTRRKLKLRWGPAVLVLIIALILSRPKIRTELERWLVPGDPEVTKAAYFLMIDELKNGDSFADAVTTFCSEIIAGAKTETVYDT